MNGQVANDVAPLPFDRKQFFYRTLEPVHIGAGGYRLGRVDMTIVREPGTNLPKIPGTSLSGAARSYAALLYGRPEAAGQGVQEVSKEQREKCPIFHTFGSATEAGGGDAGTVSFGDAHIVFFPVRSLYGCVWVTCRRALKYARIEFLPANLDADKVATDLAKFQQEKSPPGLNLGWLWFESVETWTPKLNGNLATLKGHTVLVDDRLFGVIVNSNLEVRTSVVIDPKTGTAAPGKLFSYEAIPRETWLVNEVIEDDYRKWANDGAFEKPVEYQFPRGGSATPKKLPENGQWERPMDVAKAGLKMMEYLGVGGMGTRGFGRLELVDAPAAPVPANDTQEGAAHEPTAQS